MKPRPTFLRFPTVQAMAPSKQGQTQVQPSQEEPLFGGSFLKCREQKPLTLGWEGRSSPRDLKQPKHRLRWGAVTSFDHGMELAYQETLLEVPS